MSHAGPIHDLTAVRKMIIIPPLGSGSYHHIKCTNYLCPGLPDTYDVNTPAQKKPTSCLKTPHTGLLDIDII